MTVRYVLLVTLLAYILVTQVVFALRHPELTDTQRFLRFVDSLFWK